MAAQGHAKQETVSLSDLIAQFLHANQAAIENSNKVGWEADRDLWNNLSDRVKRNVEVDVREEMLKAPSENKKDRLWKKLNPTKGMPSGSQQEYTGSSGKGGKDSGNTGKSWKNWQTPKPTPYTGKRLQPQRPAKPWRLETGYYQTTCETTW